MRRQFIPAFCGGLSILASQSRRAGERQNAPSIDSAFANRTPACILQIQAAASSPVRLTGCALKYRIPGKVSHVRHFRSNRSDDKRSSCIAALARTTQPRFPPDSDCDGAEG